VVRALASVPGAEHAAEATVLNWKTEDGAAVTAIAVDPDSYAALVASTPWPAFPAGKLAGPVAGTAPALASPAAAAVLGHGSVPLPAGEGPAQLRVVGLLSTTPAVPAGGAFVIVPSWSLPAQVRSQPPNLMLITGPGLDGAALAAATHRLLPTGDVVLRSSDLAGLADSPLPRGAYLGFAVGVAAAAGFSVAVLLLELALGADTRRMTLARLATMGLGSGQARRLTLLETLPGVLAAAIAGAGCALVLVPLTAPLLDLSVFTGSGAGVPVRPDFGALGLPVAGLIVIAVGALLLQIRVERQRGVVSALRVGQ
jgi:putative ABC transport system permease protein